VRAPYGGAGRDQSAVPGASNDRGNRDAELRLLLNEITIGETYMFRTLPARCAPQRILPEILQAKGSIGLKGCVSVRWLLHRRGAVYHRHVSSRRERQAANRLDWEILATDLNDNR